MPSESKRSERRIVFFAGPAWEPWSPETIEHSGIGGSETALARVAELLAARGWPVEVYSDVFEGEVSGVSYRRFDRWDPGADVAAFVGFRRPDTFDKPIAAPVRAFWCHDAHLGESLTAARAESMTTVIAVSEWHRALLADDYPFLARKLQTVRNGVKLRDSESGRDAFPYARRPFGERRPQCIYSSNPGYGLRLLLELWPEIRRRVPDAELHLFSGWEVYDRVADDNPRLRASKVLLLHVLAQAEKAGGIVQQGRVGQPELHEAMQRARVWSYSALVRETSCIGAMEARASGLPIVTSDLAALPETVGRDRGILVSLDDDAHYRAAFTESVVQLLLDESFWTSKHELMLQDAQELDWAERGEDWERVLRLTRSV